ncbi:MAG: hypothetical protein WCK21_03650 [Actinomycetota bacterium]
MNLPPPLPAAPSGARERAWAPPATPTEPLTARDLLGDDPSPLAAELGRSLQETLATGTPIVRKAALRELHKGVSDATGFSLADVVIRAWSRHKALHDAAERTRSGGREVVTLADHTVSSVHQPTLTLTIDGIDLLTLKIGVDLSIRMVGVAAVVERGALVAVESGASTVTAVLKIDGHKVSSRSREFEASRVVTLAQPRSLLRENPR